MNGRKVSYATIKDVAELAETSVATVSYILSGKSEKSFRQDTVDRVMAAVEELNYSKNAIASGLRGNKRGMIYIIIPQFSNIYYTRVCEAIENVLFENGLVPAICDTREDPEREKRLLELAISQRCDGIVLGPTIRGWENTAAVRSLNIPLVVVGRELGSPNDQKSYYYVGDDSYQAGYLAGSVLAKGGQLTVQGAFPHGCPPGVALLLQRMVYLLHRELLVRIVQQEGQQPLPSLRFVGSHSLPSPFFRSGTQYTTYSVFCQ